MNKKTIIALIALFMGLIFVKVAFLHSTESDHEHEYEVTQEYEHTDEEHSDEEHSYEEDHYTEDEHSDEEHTSDEHSDDEHSDEEHSDEEEHGGGGGHGYGRGRYTTEDDYLTFVLYLTPLIAILAIAGFNHFTNKSNHS